MKNTDLIKKLQEFPPDMEVAIFDWRQNAWDNMGDGSDSGIHLEFEVNTIVNSNVDPFLALAFSNGDYEEVEERKCRVCGCTDEDCRQCIEKTGSPCHWVEVDLCSACIISEPETDRNK